MCNKISHEWKGFHIDLFIKKYQPKIGNPKEGRIERFFESLDVVEKLFL